MHKSNRLESEFVSDDRLERDVRFRYRIAAEKLVVGRAETSAHARIRLVLARRLGEELHLWTTTNIIIFAAIIVCVWTKTVRRIYTTIIRRVGYSYRPKPRFRPPSQLWTVPTLKVLSRW